MWGVWQKFQTQYWIERTFTAVHERKGSIVINVFMKKTEFNCDHCVQKFHQSLQFGNTYTNSSWVTQNTGLKLQITAVNENEKFNCDQCGKIFSRTFNLKFIHEYNNKYFTKAFNLWEIFHKIITLNAHIKRTHEAQRNYDCDSCGKSSTQLGNVVYVTN